MKNILLAAMLLALLSGCKERVVAVIPRSGAGEEFHWKVSDCTGARTRISGYRRLDDCYYNGQERRKRVLLKNRGYEADITQFLEENMPFDKKEGFYEFQADEKTKLVFSFIHFSYFKDEREFGGFNLSYCVVRK